MKRLISSLLFLSAALLLNAQPATSPNGKLSAKTAGDRLVISLENQTVLEMAALPESFCICLSAFLEAGLLKSEDGTLYGARRAEIDGKADLEATEIMRRLRQLQSQ